MSLTWNNSLAVGIRTFDEQHQKLFQLTHSLEESMESGLREEELRHILADLIRYTMTHFQAEETAMKAFSYPDLSAHHKQHEKLTQQTLAFVQRYRHEATDIGTSLSSFLQEWLTQHIQASDSRLSEFLRTRGYR